MAQDWPTTAPSVGPGTHDPVATQAYQAGGGDYFRSGYYSLGTENQPQTTLALTVNRLVLTPFRVPVRRAFDRIGINVTTAATAASGGVLRMGLYASSGGIPGSLIVDAGTISSETAGGREVVISQTLDPGVYWIGVCAQVAACTVTAHFSLSTGSTVRPFGTSPPTSTGLLGYFVNLISGALPGTGPANDLPGAIPCPALRAA